TNTKIVFSWLEGNGAVARAIICGDPEYACYKCLTPVLGGNPRFRTVRRGHDADYIDGAKCRDGVHVAFPASRAVGSAVLAFEIVFDWANGRTGRRLRTHVFDEKSGVRSKDSSPRPTIECPACQNK